MSVVSQPVHQSVRHDRVWEDGMPIPSKITCMSASAPSAVPHSNIIKMMEREMAQAAHGIPSAENRRTGNAPLPNKSGFTPMRFLFLLTVTKITLPVNSFSKCDIRAILIDRDNSLFLWTHRPESADHQDDTHDHVVVEVALGCYEHPYETGDGEVSRCDAGQPSLQGFLSGQSIG